MNILILTNKFPYPTNDGSSLAIYNLASGLSDAPNVRVTLFAINTTRHFKNPANVPERERRNIQWETVNLNTNITPWGVLQNLWASAPYHASRFFQLEGVEALKNLLQKQTFDVVQLETAYMGSYLKTIREYSTARVVLRAHNTESLLWMRTALATKNPIKKWYLKMQARRLLAFEKALCQQVDALVPISTVDGQQLLKFAPNVPQCVVPFGLNLDAYPVLVGQKNSIRFLGSMDWLPNQVGLQWFLVNIWPLVTRANKSAHLKLAGKAMPQEFFKFANASTQVQDFVPNAIQFLAAAQIVVVPILSGSGIRIKMIEALACGKVVVATSIGAEGILGEPGVHFITADQPQDFAQQLLNLLENPEKVHEIGKNARILATEHFSNKQLIVKLLHFYNNL